MLYTVAARWPVSPLGGCHDIFAPHAPRLSSRRTVARSLPSRPGQKARPLVKRPAHPASVPASFLAATHFIDLRRVETGAGYIRLGLIQANKIAAGLQTSVVGGDNINEIGSDRTAPPLGETSLADNLRMNAD